MIRKKREAAAATANRSTMNYSRLALAVHRVYIGAAGAKSLARFSSLKPKRRVSATTTKQGAFFVPACFMAASRWEIFGSAGFLFGRSANLMQAATRLLAEASAVPTQKGAVHHEQPQSYQPQPDPFARPSRSPVPLAHGRTRNKPPSSSSGHRPHTRRGKAHFQPLLPRLGRGREWPFCDLTAVKKLFEVTP